MVPSWRDNPVYRRDRAAWRRPDGDRPRGLVVLVGVFAVLTGLLARRWGLPYDPNRWFGAPPPAGWVEPARAAVAVLPMFFGALVVGMMTIADVCWGREGELDELYLSRLGGREIVGAKLAALVAPLAWAFGAVACVLVADAAWLVAADGVGFAAGAMAAAEAVVGAAAAIAAMALVGAQAWHLALRTGDPWRAFFGSAGGAAAVAGVLFAAHVALPDALLDGIRFLRLHEDIPRQVVQRQVAPVVAGAWAALLFAFAARVMWRRAAAAFDRTYAHDAA